MDTNPKHAWFKITKGAIIFIFIYYILLLTISASILFTQLSVKLNSPEVITFTNTIFCSIFLSIIGAATFYIRKLYKACINLDVNQPKEESDKIRQIELFSTFYWDRFSQSFFLSLLLLLPNPALAYCQKEI